MHYDVMSIFPNRCSQAISKLKNREDSEPHPNLLTPGRALMLLVAWVSSPQHRVESYVCGVGKQGRDGWERGPSAKRDPEAFPSV